MIVTSAMLALVCRLPPIRRGSITKRWAFSSPPREYWRHPTPSELPSNRVYLPAEAWEVFELKREWESVESPQPQWWVE